MNWKKVDIVEFNKYVAELLRHPESRNKLSEYENYDNYPSQTIITWDLLPVARCWDTEDNHYHEINADEKGLI